MLPLREAGKLHDERRIFSSLRLRLGRFHFCIARQSTLLIILHNIVIKLTTGHRNLVKFVVDLKCNFPHFNIWPDCRYIRRCIQLDGTALH